MAYRYATVDYAYPQAGAGAGSSTSLTGINNFGQISGT
jgi:hypothetical protein